MQPGWHGDSTATVLHRCGAVTALFLVRSGSVRSNSVLYTAQRYNNGETLLSGVAEVGFECTWGIFSGWDALKWYT